MDQSSDSEGEVAADEEQPPAFVQPPVPTACNSQEDTGNKKSRACSIRARFPSNETLDVLDAHALAYPDYPDVESAKGLQEDDPAMQKCIKKILELYCCSVEGPPLPPRPRARPAWV